jgi:alpha-galactosidase
MREYLIGRLEYGVREWGLDGLNLDFVDLFVPPEKPDLNARKDGRDFDGVPEAGDHLLTQIMDRLKKIRPEIMIEFRQWYTGPLMRKYGNMLRAADCPDCPTSNRTRTIDIRLLAGNTPAHCDMLDWNMNETAESAALQLLHSLFSVPQISVLLDKIPESHCKMLRFWLGFWRENRDVLLDGHLEPLYPQWLYPAIRSSTGRKRIVAVYADFLADIGVNVPEILLIVNSMARPGISVKVHHTLSSRRMRVFDTTGNCIADKYVTLNAGIHALDVPPSGLMRLEKE